MLFRTTSTILAGTRPECLSEVLQRGVQEERASMAATAIMSPAQRPSRMSKFIPVLIRRFLCQPSIHLSPGMKRGKSAPNEDARGHARSEREQSRAAHCALNFRLLRAN